ncbi:MAG: GAF domain-containing protein [Gemmatimonadetes bacterium]|nr:MAG: GAF domain-containing protein [Gemmatimonadota bacterium]
MTPAPSAAPALPEPVRRTLDEFRTALDLELCVCHDADPHAVVYPDGAPLTREAPLAARTLAPRTGPALRLEVHESPLIPADRAADLLAATLERTFDFAQEVRFFTYELSERYEEINLLYSISEILGSILRLEDAALRILQEVCDVLGALRGSLWVFDPHDGRLHLRAAVGEDGVQGPLDRDDPDAITAQAFREGRPLIASRVLPRGDGAGDATDGQAAVAGEGRAVATSGNDPDVAVRRSGPHSVLSVPIRYTPPSGEPRTVGVINLLGRRNGGRFNASDQKLLSAIASQVGAALENNRLIRESLAQERMGREMELAHNLQMKLLQRADSFEAARVAARVVPAEQVGGDFYHLFNLPEGRIGVMIGDVSTHGFPAALIMALSMSAASIYAGEFGEPARVLRHLDDALRDELETTEMYLSLFYGVIDPAEGALHYSNAGHPHAFVFRASGDPERLMATDPPVGIAGDASFQEAVAPWRGGEDLLFLFTDGLSDTLTTAERAGEAIVLDAVAGMRDREPAEIVDALFRMAAEATPEIPSDDRTALVLRTGAP